MVRGLGKRVDLDLGGVLLHEDLVELLDGVDGLVDALRAEAELLADAAGHLVGHALVDVDRSGDDGLWVLLGHGLDVHATLAGSHNDGSLRSAVHEDGKVELAAGELALNNVDAVADAAALASLLGDELVADHLFGENASFARTAMMLGSSSTLV